MNNSIKIFFLISSLTLLSSCCSNLSKDKSESLTSESMLKNPASVAINKSIVHATIKEILFDGKENFKIKALITNVEEDPAYSNMAVVDEIYDLIPNFQLDDDKKIIADSERNEKMKLLSKQKPGTEFKAVIFFENPRGWFVQEVL